MLTSEKAIVNILDDVPTTKVFDVAKKPYTKGRPSYIIDQVEKAWKNSKDLITGKVYDPTGVEIIWF